MVTSKYYQHLYRLVTNESTQDATGAWVQGSKTWVYVGLCHRLTLVFHGVFGHGRHHLYSCTHRQYQAHHCCNGSVCIIVPNAEA